MYAEQSGIFDAVLPRSGLELKFKTLLAYHEDRSSVVPRSLGIVLPDFVSHPWRLS
jgi:hypothetical protein